MAGLDDLARSHTPLRRPEIDRLQRLVATWGLLADLCFSDLLLFGADAPGDQEPGELVVLAQIRPTTSQTLFVSDRVGARLSVSERPLVAECLRTGALVEGDASDPERADLVHEWCIPVSHEGRTIAVLTRESLPVALRQAGELERTYIGVFDRLAAMIAAGSFPFAGEDALPGDAPRVGDGVLVLGAGMEVVYASPNAVSALHRLGVHQNSMGRRFDQLGLSGVAVGDAFAHAKPVTEEVERGLNVTVIVRVLPLLDDDEVTGALVLVRDISELRRRDRMLLSKDATIREIHHRVKNNLQTVSALLRLQGRRTSSVEAKAAIDESVRRIRSIALVHETLSHAVGDDIPFVEIVRPLVRMVADGLISPERPISFMVEGDGGILPAETATRLAVVLTELLQNVVDHAFPAGFGEDAFVRVELSTTGQRLLVNVVDNGVGPSEGFTIDDSSGLGLSIVRTLVTSELGGTIGLSAGDGPPERPGTTIRLSVPVV